jgi:anti-sigma factor ChrR (cupin superfamily)
MDAPQPDLLATDVEHAAAIVIGPGCTRRDLPARAGVRIWVVDIAAGAQWPHVDQHDAMGEFVYVVSGELIEGDRRYGPGHHLAYAAHSRHQPRTDTGVRLYGFNLFPPEPRHAHE